MTNRDVAPSTGICYATCMSEQRRTVRVTRLCDQGRESDSKDATPEECVGMMWQLAQDAWAMKGNHDAEIPLPRHIVRVIRRGS